MISCRHPRLQFEQDGERGVLLFTATMTVLRNGRTREVLFDTQAEAFDLDDRRGATLPTIAASRETGGRKVCSLKSLHPLCGGAWWRAAWTGKEHVFQSFWFAIDSLSGGGGDMLSLVCKVFLLHNDVNRQ